MVSLRRGAHIGGVCLLTASLGVLMFCTAQISTAPPTKDCASGVVNISLTPIDPAVTISCAGGSKRNPASTNQAAVYRDGRCEGDQVQALSNLLQSGTATWKDNTLTVTKFPPETKKVCYECKNNDNVTCTAVIEVMKTPDSCTPGNVRSGTDLPLRIEVGKTVFFSCPTGHTLDPSDAGQTYTDSSCTKQENVANEIERVERKTEQETNVAVKLKKAPTTDRTFCYKCTSNNLPRSTTECKIKIQATATTTVEPDASQPESPTDTSTPTTTSTAAKTAGGLLALGPLIMMFLSH